MSFKFRPYAGGSLEEAMKQLQIFDTRSELNQRIKELCIEMNLGSKVTDDMIEVKRHPFGKEGVPDRDGWDTHVVTVKSVGGFLGYTDQAVEK